MGEYDWNDLREKFCEQPMAVTRSKTFEEAVRLLNVMVNNAMERELDWVALSAELNGKPNPEYDPAYAVQLLQHPEEIFSPNTWAAKQFLKRLGK